MRAPQRYGHRPPGTTRPGCEELAVRAAEEMLQTEARPPAVNRHGGAPRGERSFSSVSAFTRVLRRSMERVAPDGATTEDNAPVGARHPSVGLGYGYKPGRHRAAGTRCAVRTRCLPL